MRATRLGILLHALGLGRRAGMESYRNHFVAGPGHDDYETCRLLVSDGLMEEHPASEITGGDPCFVVTEAGKRFALGSLQGTLEQSKTPEDYPWSRTPEELERNWLIQAGLITPHQADAITPSEVMKAYRMGCGALKQANDQAELFERKFYLAVNDLEKISELCSFATEEEPGERLMALQEIGKLARKTRHP